MTAPVSQDITRNRVAYLFNSHRRVEPGATAGDVAGISIDLGKVAAIPFNLGVVANGNDFNVCLKALPRPHGRLPAGKWRLGSRQVASGVSRTAFEPQRDHAPAPGPHHGELEATHIVRGFGQAAAQFVEPLRADRASTTSAAVSWARTVLRQLLP